MPRANYYMTIFVSLGVAYSLAKAYKMDGITSAVLSLMCFLLVAAPAQDGSLAMKHMLIRILRFFLLFRNSRKSTACHFAGVVSVINQ